MDYRRSTRVCGAILTVLSGWSCLTDPESADIRGPLEPADFAVMPSSDPQDQQHAGSAHAAAALTPDAPLPPDRAAVPTSRDHRLVQKQEPERRTYTVDAMVGQVNGRPIYAETVFEPIIEQLAVLGRRLPGGEFRSQARQLIESRLGQMVADLLILGKAEGDLSDQEQFGLQNILKQQREELIRFWGKGSVALADETLIRQTSRSLDQTLTETRQRLLVQRYLRQELWPKINVTRKDIERYYVDHIDEYRPPVTRTLRLIYVQDEPAASRVAQRLERGEPFEQVAALSVNQYRPHRSGLMSQKAVGDQVFDQRQLNEAMLLLNAGDHSPRIESDGKYWWIYADSIDQGQSRSLSQVQLEIEQRLRRQRFQSLTQRYRQELFATGSFHPIELMSEVLLQIAVSRFAVVR